ncbi:MAG: pantoate--beta-alanine ligase [Candidatus Saganbacteria bacterium]|nr:pantoate--beta-alanine ligase [Candidatus Saganbacteria bacterium]
MREIKRLREMYLYSLKAKSHGKKVGFVPTMGALHEGHLSLVEEAKRRCDIVVVSIFVNPLQFAPSEDFARYPRNLRRDRQLLKNFGVDVLFLPDAGQLYPPGFKTFVEVESLPKKMCGRTRPTHFRGVTTVVAKLFSLVNPDLAFFGEKDFQQQRIIRQMAADLNLPVEVVALPTVREFDGLAMSSRNAYLNPRERKAAPVLYRALSLAQREVQGGERDVNKILFRLRSLIGSEPLVRLDYLLAVDPETLQEVKQFKGKVLFALAAYIGKTRLIDNVVVG